MADIAWPLGKLKPIAARRTGSSGRVLLKNCFADDITMKLPNETTGILNEYHRCFLRRKNTARIMFAGTRNSPVAKNVMNRIMRVLVSVTNGRIRSKTPMSKFVLSTPKMLLTMNPRLTSEKRKMIRTIISSMDRSAMLANNFRMCRTMVM